MANTRACGVTLPLQARPANDVRDQSRWTRHVRCCHRVSLEPEACSGREASARRPRLRVRRESRNRQVTAAPQIVRGHHWRTWRPRHVAQWRCSGVGSETTQGRKPRAGGRTHRQARETLLACATRFPIGIRHFRAQSKNA